MAIRHLLGAALIACLPSLVCAQATRTWVSGVGDDVNPCSRTAPCKTFAGAISKTAANGEINALDSGGFGAVTIVKAMTIDGGGNLAGILAAGSNGVVVNAGPNDTVVLRNLDINGVGPAAGSLSGISFLAGLNLIVENTKIYGFKNNGIYFAPSAGNANLLVNDVTISHIVDTSAGLGAAIRIAPGAASTATATVANTRMTGNDRGLIVLDGGVARISHSYALNNTNAGLAANSSGRVTKLIVDSTVSSGNNVGLRSAGGAVFAANSLISGNNTGVLAISGTITSFGNNRVIDNADDGIFTGTALLR
jgi:hypothetical protein